MIEAAALVILACAAVWAFRVVKRHLDNGGCL